MFSWSGVKLCLAFGTAFCIHFLTLVKFWLVLRFCKTVNFNHKISHDNCQTFHFASDFEKLSYFTELCKAPPVFKGELHKEASPYVF